MPDISSALNKVEQVLIQYRAFQDIREALEVALQAERIVVELNLQEAALRESITALVRQEIALSDHLDAMMEARVLEADEAIAAKKALYLELDVQCDSARHELEATQKYIADQGVMWETRRDEMVSIVDRLHDAADAQEARLVAARQAVDDLKAQL